MYKFNELRSQIYKIISEWQKLYYHIYSYSDSQTLCLIFYFFIFFFNIITLCIYFRQIHSLNVKINYYFFFYLFYILLCTYFTYNLYLIRYNVKNVLLVTFGLTAAGHATILILEQNVHVCFCDIQSCNFMSGCANGKYNHKYYIDKAALIMSFVYKLIIFYHTILWIFFIKNVNE